MIELQLYNSKLKGEWNHFVSRAINHSFLHYQDYMSYHSDRYVDFSILIRNNKKIIALLPANRQDDVLFSHQGLTYGGFIVGNKWNTKMSLDVLKELLIFLKKHKFKQIIYKPMPYIYGSKPFQEDLYAIYVNNGKLLSREVSSTLSKLSNKKYNKGRKWGVNKAKKNSLIAQETDKFDIFYEILSFELEIAYNKNPVHSLPELKMLKNRFPDNIRLFNVVKDDEIIAGTIIFENPTVAHVQYITSNEKGRNLFALDFLFDHLIKDIFSEKLYFDFGISTEKKGMYLNEGLVQFKESFGASGVCYDTYGLDLK